MKRVCWIIFFTVVAAIVLFGDSLFGTNITSFFNTFTGGFLSSPVNVGRKHLGETETKNSLGVGNFCRFNRWYFGSDYTAQWCGTFVSYCFYVAGRKLPAIDSAKGFASVVALYNFAVTNDLIVAHPSKNCVVIYDFENDGNPDHCGIFDCDNGDGTFTAIEGNTSDVNDSNGGAVMAKVRKYLPNYYFVDFSLCK